MNQMKKICRLKNANSYLNNHSEIWTCVYSLESNLFAWSDRNGTINIINFNEFNLKDSIKKHEEAMKQQESSQNQDLLIDIDKIQQTITCGESIWSLAFGSSKSQVINKRSHHQHKNVNTRFKLRNILILAVGLESGKIFIYDALKCSLLFILRDHRDIVRGLKFSKNGSFQLASVSRDETIKVILLKLGLFLIFLNSLILALGYVGRWKYV
jgi:WD40 repeat protein